jgi:hypothetical protein
MKAVVRVALAYFTFAPLQSWLSALGLLLVAVGLAVRVAAAEPGGTALALSIMGGILVVLGPVFGGGVMLRIASSRPTMMLRPGARLRLILGTTLAMSIVVLLVTLPFLLDAPVGPRGNPAPVAADVFAIAWGAMALNVAGVFALSVYRFGLAFVWIVPVVGANLPRFIPRPQLPDPIDILIAGLLLWGAFAAWYLRRRSHGPVSVLNSGTGSSDGVAPILRFHAPTRLSLPRSVPQARHQWLHAGTSLLNHVAVGAGQSLLVVILFLWLVDRPQARDDALMGNLLYIGVMASCFSLGYWLVGRSRTLWLRAGLDRAGLLRQAETSGLLPVMVSSLIATLIVTTAQASQRPDLMPTIALNALTQLVLAACLAYWGLSQTRSWSFKFVLECIALFVLVTSDLIVLGADRPPTRLLAALAVLTLLALWLRTRAMRHWRALDWRVKRPQMNQRWGMGTRT